MASDIWGTILDFKWLLIGGVALGLGVLALGVALSENLSWNKKRMKFFGIFYGLNTKEALWLSVGLTRTLLVLMIVSFAMQLKLDHTVFYLTLFVVYNALFFNAKRFLTDFVNSLVIYAAMMASNILIGFYRDVNGDDNIMTIFILLSVFIALYAIYFYLRGIAEFLASKKITGSERHELG